MTGANMKLVTVNVRLNEGDEDPQQHLDQVYPLLSTPPSFDLEAPLKV